MPITITRLDKPFWVVCGDSTPPLARVRVNPLEPAQDDNIKAEALACIVGWENVRDQDGEDVPFAAGHVERLGWDILLRALRCKRGLDDPLVDRSGTSSTPSSGESNGNPGTPA